MLASISQVKKFWATILLFGTLTTLFLYIVLVSRPSSLSPQEEEATLDNSSKRRYPVESALVDLFPKEVYDRVNAIGQDKQQQHTFSQVFYGNTLLTSLLNRLFQWIPRRRSFSFSWTRYYRLYHHHYQQVSSDSPNNTPSYRCENQALPYPILYHMVMEALKLNNSDLESSSPDLTRPFILLPFDPSETTLSSNEPICIRAIIPPSVLAPPATKSPFHYRYQPTSPRSTDNDDNSYGLNEPIWWDMMQVSARHLSTNASTTFDMRPWDGHRTLRQGYQKKWFEHENNVPNWSRWMILDMEERGWLHIYQVDAVLHDPGAYLLNATLEFQDAYWNTDLGPVQPYLPLTLPIEPGAQLVVAGQQQQQQQISSSRDDLKRLVLEHLDLPLCQAGRGDYQGRWLPWPFGDQVDGSRMVAGLDKHGKFWAPLTCRYRPLSHNQFHRCLARRFPGGLNIYGDSNMRRSIKSFLSHGQWCKNYQRYTNETSSTLATQTFDTPRIWHYLGNPNQLRACQCEDFKEPTWNQAWFNATARRWDMVFENTEEESSLLGYDTEWDSGSKQATDGVLVSSYKWDGLTFMNDRGWDVTFTQPAYQLPTTADLVVISLVNWDMAYMQLDEFKHALQSLLKHLNTYYYDHQNDHPRLIYRTPQYYCCRVDQTARQRKSNTARMKEFDQVARQLFQAEFGDDLMIWDVTTMGESRTWEEKLEGAKCGANHAQADVIHLENQVLMNALCNGLE